MSRVPPLPALLAASLVIPAAALLLPAGGAGAAGTAPAPLPAPAAATPAPSPSAGTPGPSGPGTPFPSGPTPSGPTPPNTSPYPPTAPADLRATRVTSTSITLTWTASAPGCCAVDHYEITWTQAFNDVIHLVNVGNVTTWTFGAEPTGIYSFRVAALDHLGHRSASSNSVSVVTPNADTGDVTPPTAPSDLRVTGTGPAGADLTWSGSTDDTGVTGYDVYRFDGLYISTRLATVPGTSFTARTTGRDMFYVRARDAAGNLSASSNIVTVIGGTSTPTPPALACRATYTTSAQWTGGFVAEVAVTNTGGAPIDGWAVTFRFGGDQRIVSAWNATATQDGAAVTLTNLAWNRTIAPGARVTAGLFGSWRTAADPPAAIAVNGVPCA